MEPGALLWRWSPDRAAWYVWAAINSGIRSIRHSDITDSYAYLTLQQ
jgi:hypothetical protein